MKCIEYDVHENLLSRILYLCMVIVSFFQNIILSIPDIILLFYYHSALIIVDEEGLPSVH